MAVVQIACTAHSTKTESDDSQERGDHADLNVVILGDSNAWIGGDSCNQPRGWNKWFNDRFAPASCYSYARSGATWTHTAQTRRNVEQNIAVLGNDNVIYNQIERLKEAYDKGFQPSPHLILIAAGTNDAWFSDKRPGIYTQTVSRVFRTAEGFSTEQTADKVISLAACVRYDCELLMQYFPDCQVILLTPPQTTATSTEKIVQVSDVIEACGHRMSIGVIRLDQEACNYDVREKQNKHFTTDGTHSSEAGARRNGYYIANRVSSMLQF
ncbi:MAG: SGNH/GDSL hydrolase family protein [Prevotella sp.]|nr:SGNH/GDSL hydrolase family protein [Prevotella sp.]